MATQQMVTEKITVRTFFGGAGVGRVFQFINNRNDDVLNIAETTILAMMRDNNLGKR